MLRSDLLGPIAFVAVGLVGVVATALWVRPFDFVFGLLLCGSVAVISGAMAHFWAKLNG